MRVNAHSSLFLVFLLLLSSAKAGATGSLDVTILAEDFWPYSFPAEQSDSEPQGICVDFAAAVLADAGIDYTVSLLPWPRVMKQFREQSNQLVISMIRSGKREKMAKWIGPVATVQHALYARSDNKQPHPESLAAARELSVASVVNDIAHNYLLEEGFTNIINTSSYLKGLEMLARGRVDLYPGNTALIAYQCRQLAETCNDIEMILPLHALEEDLYFAMSLNTDNALIDKVRTSFQKLTANGTLDDIRRQYLSAKRSSMTLSD